MKDGKVEIVAVVKTDAKGKRMLTLTGRFEGEEVRRRVRLDEEEIVAWDRVNDEVNELLQAFIW
jgi:hypothetical protein